LAITRPKKTVTTQGKNPKQANMHTKRECMQDHAMCTPKCINGAFKPQPNLANGRLPTFWQITVSQLNFLKFLKQKLSTNQIREFFYL